MDTLWQIVKVLIGIYVGLGLLLYLLQSRLIYYPNLPSRQVTHTPADIGLDYESVTLRSEGGIKLDGWYVPSSADRGSVLFLHGNAGNIGHRLDSLGIFHRLGYSTLIFDYRGYGRSEGRMSEQGSYQDAIAAWRYLVEQRNVPGKEIVVFGRSLGGSIASWLAVRHRPKGLIVESAFTSVPDFAASLYPIYPARLLSRFSYDTRAYLQQVDCPVLVVHSEQDEIIPYRHGRRLYASASEPKQMLTLQGGHNDGFLASGQRYVDGLQGFLESIN